MKTTASFRLNSQTNNYLTLLAEEENDTKTGVLEKAIYQYYTKKKEKKSPIARFAGILSEEQGGELLRVIKENRVDKDIKIF